MRFFLISLVIILGGCQAIPETQAPSPPEAIVKKVVADVEPIIVEPPKPHFIVKNIMDLSQGTLQNILGKPSLIRTEKNAQVWLYDNDQCVMHLYFYPNDMGDFRLDYVETAAVDLSADNPTVSANACLDSHVIHEVENGAIIGDPQPSYLETDKGLPRGKSDN